MMEMEQAELYTRSGPLKSFQFLHNVSCVPLRPTPTSLCKSFSYLAYRPATVQGVQEVSTGTDVSSSKLSFVEWILLCSSEKSAVSQTATSWLSSSKEKTFISQSHSKQLEMISLDFMYLHTNSQSVFYFIQQHFITGHFLQMLGLNQRL